MSESTASISKQTKKPERKQALDRMADVWQKALEQFAQENNVSIEELTKAGDFGSASDGISKATTLFQNSRHPKDRTDKAIAAVGSCLDWIDDSVGFIKDHVSGTYATPVQAIAGAISLMIKAAKNVTEDFNLIEQTFETIQDAIKDIGLLQDRRPVEDHFLERLTEIFLSLFNFCSYTRKMFKEHSRKRLYVRALLKGRNQKIQERCEGVTKAILIFRATVPLKILSVVEQIDEKLDNFPNSFIKALQDIRLKPSDLQILTKKNTTLEKVQKMFGRKAQMETQMDLIGSHFVEGTFSWLKNDRDYTTWFQGQNTPFLTVSGAQGTGKTYFTYHCYRVIHETSKAYRLSPEPTKMKHHNVSVAYFFFDPGRPEAQTVQDALKNIITQIAAQDSRYCDSISKESDIDKTGKVEQALKDDIETLWKTYITGKFERVSESSRMLYLLLDGVDQLNQDDSKILLKLFQDLNCDKNAIQIMMTGTPDRLKEMELRSASINLFERANEKGDIKKIIDYRIEVSEALSKFSADGRTQILNHLGSKKRGVISTIDLTLSLMEQSVDEKSALEKMKKTDGPEGLYASMIEMVRSGRSKRARKSLTTLFEWCTFAKQPLSVHEIQQIWNLDPSLGEFLVKDEILDKSKTMLYTIRRTPPQDDPDDLDYSRSKAQDEKNASLVPSPKTAEAANDTRFHYIAFRQASLQDHLESTHNEMIPQPLQAKVDIFTRLSSVLCDSSPTAAEARKVLHGYAMWNFAEHLLDIDVKDASPLQGRHVVEAITGLLSNQNEACVVMESVMQEKWSTYVPLDLYQYGYIAERIVAWAKKMYFYEEEELSPQAREWVETTIQQPKNILDALARGHIESLSRRVDLHDAKTPYGLAYSALIKSRDLYHYFYGEIDVEAAEVVLNFADEEYRDNYVKRSKIRIALAVLLNAGMPDCREKALELYMQNVRNIDDIPGPEKFYSYVGLAEYHAELPGSKAEMSPDEITKTWKEVVKYADKALQIRQDEQGPLGSELDHRRCTAAFWMKAKAKQSLGEDTKALEICTNALHPGELEYSRRLLDFLTMLTSIHSKNREYSKLIDAVQSYPFKTRAEWLWHRSPEFTDKSDVLREAVVLTRRVDFLILLYEDAIEYWQSRDWENAQCLQYELAVIYRRDVRTTKMAEITLETIMTTVMRNLARRGAGNVLRFCFPEMVDILFEEYSMSRSKTGKEDTVIKLRRLISDLDPTGILENMTLAAAMLSLAKMFRGLGDIHSARIQAGRAFDLCIDDLQDSVGYNDAPAFRMIAKVLMFAGLELDAGIALSLQFSDVDKAYDDSETRSDFSASSPPSVPPPISRRTSTSSEEARASRPPPPSSLPPLESAMGIISVTTEAQSPVEDDGHRSNDKQKSEKDLSVMHTESLAGNAEGTSPITSSSETQKDETTVPKEIIPEQASRKMITNGLSPGGNEANTQALPTSSAAQSPHSYKPQHKVLPRPKISDQDLIVGSPGFTCNGPCRSPSFRNWEVDNTTGEVAPAQAFYCLDCYEVDLCSKCHAVQEAYYKHTGEGFWFKCCWGPHQYVQQPVEGWLGVKDGIIRVGDKRRPFKDWIEAVREKWRKKLMAM